VGNIVDTATAGPTINLVCTTPANCGTTTPVETDDAQPGRAPVTLADIAAFHPVTGATELEPNGWAVVGLDANPFSTTQQHTVAGRLLGGAAEVRFTPLAWHWDYGDGAARDSTAPGRSWRSLNAAEFSRTATSHAYDRAGTYAITPNIRYSAEYRLAAGTWTPIAGTLTVAGQAVTVTVGTATTVLVGADCASNSSGPGC
jgi:hypothetical protein